MANMEQRQPQEHHDQQQPQCGRRRRRRTEATTVLLLLAAVAAILAQGAGAFLVAGGGAGAAGAAAGRRIAAAGARAAGAPVAGAAGAVAASRREATRLFSLLDLGSLGGGGEGEVDENSDFYNPEGIKEGDTVEVVKDSVFYSIPKTPKEGVHVKGFKGTVASLKFTDKKGVPCSANRPVVVKFTEPYKFQGHFEFRELKKL